MAESFFSRGQELGIDEGKRGAEEKTRRLGDMEMGKER
jgi:hypothetical protein